MSASWAALRLGFARLRSHAGLTIGLVLAMTSLVAVWVGVPLYAESASSRLLSQQVDDASAESVPFGYLFSFNRLSSETQTWDAITELSSFLEDDRTSFGSTVRSQQRVTETLPFDLFDAGGLDVRPDDVRLDRLPFTAVNTFANPAFTLTSGRLPEDSAGDGAGEVLISDELSESLAISAGQELVIVNPRSSPEANNWRRPIRVTGTWSLAPGTDAGSADGRFLRTSSVRQSLLVSEATIASFVTPLDSPTVASAQWLVLLDPSRVTTNNVDALVARSNRLSRDVDDVLPGVRMSINPGSSLETYQDDVLRLNDGLRSFSLPTLAMVFAVVGLSVAMKWRTRGSELRMLRSRGLRSGPVVFAGVIEALVLALVAMPFGVVAASLVARLIGRTETFLRIGDGVDLAIVSNSRAISSVLGAAVVLVLAQLVPYISLLGWTRRARRTVTATGREGSWWQRGRSDIVAALVIGAFAWFVVQSQSISGNLLDDPVVILLPAAVTLACGLLVLRVVPAIAFVVASGLERTNSTAALLAFRKAARSPAASAAPLLLLVLTGALSIYTASLARTMDLQLVDRAHHVVGGTNRIVSRPPVAVSNFGFAVPNGPPVDATGFDRIWGVESASRVALLPGRAQGQSGGDPLPIEVHAVDPTTFAQAAFWRDDYATQTLPTLMSRLLVNRDGVLLRRVVMARNDISIGDTVIIRASNGDVGIDLAMVVVGHYDQFPAWEPSEPLSPAVVSLPDLEQRLGTSLPSRVIFTATDGGRDDGQTRADFARLGIDAGRVQRAGERVERAQLEPERQGVFGLLTVSFLLSSLLTIAGFVFYAVASSRRQRTELGMLRASGLAQRSLLTYVALDLLIVAFFGIGAAVLIGATMSRVLLPRLVGTAAGSAPSLLPEIDWLATASIAAALLVVFILATAMLLSTLRRIRLFEAIKIGGEQ